VPEQSDRSALIGAAVAGASGLLLFISLFMTWYEFPGAGIGGQVGDVLGLDVGEALTRSGWEAFEVLDVVCVIAAGVAVARAGVALLEGDANPTIPGSILTLALGAVALAFILYRVVNPPGIGLERELGLWVGAFAAGGIVYGSFLAMQSGRLPGPTTG
jgi:hypothetical protein